MGFCCAVALLSTVPVSAAPIFSQTPSSNVDAFPSDRDTGDQHADDFTLTAGTTARSVTWRGFYAFNNTLAFPL